MDDTDIRLSIRESATKAERALAERSVAALAARTRVASRHRRTAEAELRERTRVLTTPLLQVIRADPTAQTALESAAAPGLGDLEMLDEIRASVTVTHADVPYGAAETGSRGRASLSFAPPYDFQWSWHDTNGSGPFSTIQDPATGLLDLDARSGVVDDGASGFVSAHAGFGVFLNWSPGPKFPHAALNPGRYGYALGAFGVGSNATSEGGIELTIFEDGQYLTGASRRLWRRRVSGSVFSPSETASLTTGDQLITGPELQFTLREGHGYTFNAGIWVYTDRSTGVGAGGAQSIMRGTLKRMWVFG